MSTLSRARVPNAQAAPAVTLTATLALLSFLMPLATDMYLPAFPRMIEELGTTASGVQSTLTAFLIGSGAGQLVLGPLSDRFGRRGPILVGAAVCTVATALCAVAPSLPVLVVVRFVAGFSGAAGLVVGRAVVADLASGVVAARLFGVLMALGGIAPVLAPLAGGVVVGGAGGWRGVFWVLAAVSAVMFLAALTFLPESLPAERRRAGDPAATARAARSVLTDRVYLGYTFAFTFGCGAVYCYIAGSPFLLQNVLGFGVGGASLAFSAGALAAAVSSAVGARLVGRHTPERLLRIGLTVLLVATFAALALALAGRLDRVPALSLIFLGFLGLGQVFGTATALAVGRVPHAAGTGSAVLGALQSAFGAAVAPLVGLGGEHTAVPMFVGMAGCALAAVLSLLLTRESAPAANPN
ncbi:multidrug effflux MFS transporter [Kitasatospora cheerisanensis]|uniref:Major facilitator superfamily (MFS) profile domain-containing protein n=1 Tax=Kitasatospora cheerisanensis KCTC 2395 TaxID=1348663 RepID=A0A066YL96_9ACTN|nr:multidrug effflux MFS transporter [Kitasatospora cheerisanensis]KDN81952.1 hypothetical protein KCH_62690 [Kitasatospora cheerisanensis KCTC 2395]